MDDTEQVSTIERWTVTVTYVTGYKFVIEGVKFHKIQDAIMMASKISLTSEGELGPIDNIQVR